MKTFKTIELGIIKSLTITTKISYRGFTFTLDKLGRLKLTDDIYHHEIRKNLPRFQSSGKLEKYSNLRLKITDKVKQYVTNRDFSNVEVVNVKEALPELLKIQALITEVINKAQKE